jgi:hypothetical protein
MGKWGQQEGQFTVREGLQWGIQMARLCVTPDGARFLRTLPRNNFDRMLNFIKFNILEPIPPSYMSTHTSRVGFDPFTAKNSAKDNLQFRGMAD